MIKINISEQDSNRVEELYYGYLALMELIKDCPSDNANFLRLLAEVKKSNLELEHAKSEVINKYATDECDGKSLTFDFVNQALVCNDNNE